MQGYDPDNFIHQYLRRIDTKIDRVIEDVQDIKIRLSNVEEQIGFLHSSVAGINRRLDRIEVRVSRLEDRAGLISPEFHEKPDPFDGPDS